MNPDRPIDLLVVIVCYNVPELTTDCLRSLVPELASKRNIQVAVCENGSGPESEKLLRDVIEEINLPGQIYLDPLAVNRGFAGGNNYLIRKALQAEIPPRYFLLLNADTVVKPGCLDYCIDLLDHEPRVGAFSCKLVNPDGSMQNPARKFPSPLRSFVNVLGLTWRFPSVFGWSDVQDPSWDRNTTSRDVDWLGGAALWLRGDLIKRIGVLDEDFTFYGEDIEICHRVWANGYRCHYDPGAVIMHIGGSSNDEQRWPTRVRNAHAWRARYLVQRKCYGRLAEWWLRAGDLATWTARIGWLTLTGRNHSPRCDESREVVQLLVSGATR